MAGDAQMRCAKRDKGGDVETRIAWNRMKSLAAKSVNTYEYLRKGFVQVYRFEGI